MCLLRIGINVIYICSRCVFQEIVHFDEINNNWIDAKYCQMTLQSARWHCSHAFIGNPWSNKRDANVEDSDCPVWILLLFSIGSIFDIKTLPVWLLRWRMAKLHSFILAKKLKIGAVQRIENLVSKYLVHK